jgi:hypothetical protein
LICTDRPSGVPVNAGRPLSAQRDAECFSHHRFADVAHQFAVEGEGQPGMGEMLAHGCVRRVDCVHWFGQDNHESSLAASGNG